MKTAKKLLAVLLSVLMLLPLGLAAFAANNAKIDTLDNSAIGNTMWMIAGGEDVAMLAPLIAVVGDVPLEGKKLFHDRLPHLMSASLRPKNQPEQGGLLVASAAGRTAGSGLFFGGLVSRAAGGRLFNGLVGCAAGCTAGSRGIHLYIPGSEILQSHDQFPPRENSERCPCFQYAGWTIQKQVRTFLLDSHLLVTG